MLSQCFLCWPAIAFTHWYKIGIHWNSSETREFDSKPVGHCLRRHARMHARTERRTRRKHNAAPPISAAAGIKISPFRHVCEVWLRVHESWFSDTAFHFAEHLQVNRQAWITPPSRYGGGVLRWASVCLRVCRLSGTTRPMFTQFCACYLMPWLVFLWRCDTLCTSGFMNDVIFAHNDVRNICDTKRHILSDSTGAARFRHRGEYSD